MIIKQGKTYYNQMELADIMQMRPQDVLDFYYDAIQYDRKEILGDYIHKWTCGGRVEYLFIEHKSAERFTGRKIFDWYKDFYNWQVTDENEYV